MDRGPQASIVLDKRTAPTARALLAWSDESLKRNRIRLLAHARAFLALGAKTTFAKGRTYAWAGRHRPSRRPDGAPVQKRETAGFSVEAISGS